MSTLKIVRASMLLVGLLFHGCGDTNAKEEIVTTQPPKRRIHLKKEPGRVVAPDRPVFFVPVQLVSPDPLIPSRNDVLAERRAEMLAQLSKVKKEVDDKKQTPVVFNSQIVAGVLEEFDNKEFICEDEQQPHFEMGDQSSLFGGILRSSAHYEDAFLEYSLSACGSEKSSNPLIRSYTFMKAIDHMQPNVVAKPLYLSAGTRLTSSNLAPVIKGITLPQNMAQCIGSDLRYMVMERFGESLHSDIFTNLRGYKTQRAIKVFAMVIEQLQVLHEAGIVHGNIQWDNVLYVVEDASGVRLIGFERAYFVDTPPKLLPHTNPNYLTNREAAGSRSVYMDDILRAYEMFRAICEGPFYTFPKYETPVNFFLIDSPNIRKFNDTIYSADPSLVPNHAELLDLLRQILEEFKEPF